MKYVVDVEYTGSFPNYCRGKWNIVMTYTSHINMEVSSINEFSPHK